MGTRSMIGAVLPDGTVGAVYCHSDGYLDWNGMRLHQDYPTIEHARKLYSMGAISALGHTFGRKHNCFAKPNGYYPNGSSFWHRDDGRPLSEGRDVYPSADDMVLDFSLGQWDAVWAYLHDGRCWHVMNHCGGYEWKPLLDALRAEGLVPINRPDITARARVRIVRVPSRIINLGD